MDTPFEADLHLHTIASSDGHSEPKDVVATALKVGLSAIAVTDHNRPAGSREVIRVAKGSGLLVVPASEVSSFNGHILALGVAEPIPKGLSPDETIRRIHAFGGLAVAAHPGRFYTGLSIQEVKASQFEPPGQPAGRQQEDGKDGGLRRPLAQGHRQGADRLPERAQQRRGAAGGDPGRPDHHQGPGPLPGRPDVPQRRHVQQVAEARRQEDVTVRTRISRSVPISNL